MDVELLVFVFPLFMVFLLLLRGLLTFFAWLCRPDPAEDDSPAGRRRARADAIRSRHRCPPAATETATSPAAEGACGNEGPSSMKTPPRDFPTAGSLDPSLPQPAERVAAVSIPCARDRSFPRLRTAKERQGHRPRPLPPIDAGVVEREIGSHALLAVGIFGFLTAAVLLLFDGSLLAALEGWLQPGNWLLLVATSSITCMILASSLDRWFGPRMSRLLLQLGHAALFVGARVAGSPNDGDPSFPLFLPAAALQIQILLIFSSLAIAVLRRDPTFVLIPVAAGFPFPENGAAAAFAVSLLIAAARPARRSFVHDLALATLAFAVARILGLNWSVHPILPYDESYRSCFLGLLAAPIFFEFLELFLGSGKKSDRRPEARGQGTALILLVLAIALFREITLHPAVLREIFGWLDGSTWIALLWTMTALLLIVHRSEHVEPGRGRTLESLALILVLAAFIVDRPGFDWGPVREAVAWPRIIARACMGLTVLGLAASTQVAARCERRHLELMMGSAALFLVLSVGTEGLRLEPAIVHRYPGGHPVLFKALGPGSLLLALIATALIAAAGRSGRRWLAPAAIMAMGQVGFVLFESRTWELEVSPLGSVCHFGIRLAFGLSLVLAADLFRSRRSILGGSLSCTAFAYLIQTVGAGLESLVRTLGLADLLPPSLILMMTTLAAVPILLHLGLVGDRPLWRAFAFGLLAFVLAKIVERQVDDDPDRQLPATLLVLGLVGLLASRVYRIGHRGTSPGPMGPAVVARADQGGAQV